MRATGAGLHVNCQRQWHWQQLSNPPHKHRRGFRMHIRTQPCQWARRIPISQTCGPLFKCHHRNHHPPSPSFLCTRKLHCLLAVRPFSRHPHSGTHHHLPPLPSRPKKRGREKSRPRRRYHVRSLTAKRLGTQAENKSSNAMSASTCQISCTVPNKIVTSLQTASTHW